MSPQGTNGTPGGETPPAVSEVDLLCQEITEAREKALAALIGRPSKREIIWFGDVHDCDRHNYYSMAEGDQRVRWDTWVQAKMEAGKAWEQIVKRELSVLGYEAMLAGEVVEVKDDRGQVIARGRTDGSLGRIGSRKLFPCEMKQMQPYVWEAIKDWRDLLGNQWTRKYVRQLMLYMHGKGEDHGLFLLGDFQGHWKLIPVYMDHALIGDVLDKIKKATDAKRDGKPPERIPYSKTVCGRCAFAHVCIPDIKLAPGVHNINTPEMSALLERRDQVLDKWAEVEKINKKIKIEFTDKEPGTFVVGNFTVTRTQGKRKGYDIPDDVKKQYEKSTPTFSNDIERFQQPDPDAIYLEPRRLLSGVQPEDEQ